MALDAHSPVVKPHPGGRPQAPEVRLQPPANDRHTPSSWALGRAAGACRRGRAGRGGSVAIRQTAAGGDDVLWSKDRRWPGALPPGELVIYEAAEVFKLFFCLFTEGTT